MSMSSNKAIKEICSYIKSLGYEYRVDINHTHPRIYFGIDGKERHIIISKTENYDIGNRLDVKKQDIRRAALELPQPKVNREVKETKKQEEPKIPIFNTNISQKAYSIKIFIMGRGILCVQVHEDLLKEFGEDKPFASIQKNPEGRLVLTFSTDKGIKPGNTRGEGFIAFRFKRDLVPFKYSQVGVDSKRLPKMIGRVRGDALISDQPIPEEILKGVFQPQTKFDLEEGRSIHDLLKDWIRRAEKAGHEVRLSVVNNELKIEISVKTFTTL